MATIDEINLLDYQAPTPEQILKAGRKPVAEPTPPTPIKDFLYYDVLNPSGRKLFDILRSLGNKEVELFTDNEAVILKTDNSKFSLQQLPANEFPLFDNNESDQSFSIAQSDLSAVFNKTQFAMAQQDVRFYLNGLLLEINPEKLNVVGTDGHRLAKTNIEIDKKNR